MDQLSDQTIHSVWQRIQQKPQPPEPPELPNLLTGLRQEAVLYTLLLNKTKNTGLKPLLKQVNSHIASVKGMCLLSGAEIQHFIPPQPRQENWETAMRRTMCCFFWNTSSARKDLLPRIRMREVV